MNPELAEARLSTRLAYDEVHRIRRRLLRAHVLLGRCYEALDVEYPPPALEELLNEIAEEIQR